MKTDYSWKEFLRYDGSQDVVFDLASMELIIEVVKHCAEKNISGDQAWDEKGRHAFGLLLEDLHKRVNER